MRGTAAAGMTRGPGVCACVTIALLALGCGDTEPVDVPRVASVSEALTVHVPGDAPTIQAALDMVSADDWVLVAAGDYTENLTVPPGVLLMGDGAGSTVVHGQVTLEAGDGQIVTGLRVTADGASGLTGAAGVRKVCSGSGSTLVLSRIEVDGFGIGVDLAHCPSIEVTRNRVRRNDVGLQIEDCTGPITDNLVLYNQDTGIRFITSALWILHNTIVGNGFGEGTDAGGAGIVSYTGSTEQVHNNILVSNHAGVNSIDDPKTTYDHNLVWGNTVNYAGYTSAGTGDVSANPLFVRVGSDDFHLLPGSPAIDVGTDDWGTEVDFDGISRPKGVTVDMGAFELRPGASTVSLVISEVMSNPLDEDLDEFVEIYNAGAAPVDLANLVLSDGDTTDRLVAFEGGTTELAPGAYGVIVDPEYQGQFAIPGGTTIVAPEDTTLGNGLSTNDPITLYDTDGVTILSTFSHPFNPGNGVSAERVDLAAVDTETNWRASPCTESAGEANCAPVTLADGVVISEVMSNPLDEATGEFVELYNGSDGPIDVGGWRLSDGDAVDTLVAWQGGSTTIAARSYAVVLDPDWPASQLFQIDPAALLLTVGDSALGNGLAVSDPVTLATASGDAVDSYAFTLSAQNGSSVEKISLSAGDRAGNWAQSSCTSGSSPGSLNCVSEASTGPHKPLVLTEIMANPMGEDTGEFIEIYNRGIDPVDAAGLLLTDGDATDVLEGYQGGSTTIAAGGYALILDREYAGDYSIPGGVTLLTTGDTTIGSGLSVQDSIRLLEPNGVEVIDTFRTPFDPGNGVSAEKIDVRAFDSPENWTPSSCTSGSSPGADNCSAVASGLPKHVAFTEVMANQLGVETGGAGELVEIINLGSTTIDLAGMWLAVGPEGSQTLDQLVAWGSGPTTLRPGAYALIVDPQYDDRYTIPSDTTLATIDDSAFGGSGIATTHWVSLIDADGVTLLAEFRYPSDPGDGISLHRVSLTAADDASNWVATSCGASPGEASCPGSTDVTSFTSFWVDRYGDESGIYWYQGIGWPAWHDASCESSIVCPGGAYGYTYRDNFPAPQPFTFQNPYPSHSVVFTERSSPTDDCGGIAGSGCTGQSFVVAPGATLQIPASTQGYYAAQTSGPTLNSFDWCGGDPDLFWALPPDGVLGPFVVEAAQP